MFMFNTPGLMNCHSVFITQERKPMGSVWFKQCNLQRSNTLTTAAHSPFHALTLLQFAHCKGLGTVQERECQGHNCATLVLQRGIHCCIDCCVLTVCVYSLAWTCRLQQEQESSVLVSALEGRGSVFAMPALKHISGTRGRVCSPHRDTGMPEPLETG